MSKYSEQGPGEFIVFRPAVKTNAKRPPRTRPVELIEIGPRSEPTRPARPLGPHEDMDQLPDAVPMLRPIEQPGTPLESVFGPRGVTTCEKFIVAMGERGFPGAIWLRQTDPLLDAERSTPAYLIGCLQRQAFSFGGSGMPDTDLVPVLLGEDGHLRVAILDAISGDVHCMPLPETFSGVVCPQIGRFEIDSGNSEEPPQHPAEVKFVTASLEERLEQLAGPYPV